MQAERLDLQRHIGGGRGLREPSWEEQLVQPRGPRNRSRTRKNSRAKEVESLVVGRDRKIKVRMMSVPQAWMVSQGVGKWKLCPLLKLTSTGPPGSLLEPPKVDPLLWAMMMMRCRRGTVSTIRSTKAAASILAEIQPAYTTAAPRRYTSDGEVAGLCWCCEGSLFKVSSLMSQC